MQSINKIKISLVIIVMSSIGAGIFFWQQNIKKPEVTQSTGNPFIEKIELEINQLKAKPENKFCKGDYNLIKYHINDFHKQNHFDKNQTANDQWKENLERNLYAAYTDKFIKQAKYVFRGSEWKRDDLKFILSEKNELKKSPMLLAGSPIDKEFTNIQTTLNKYNEIASFISSCNHYGYVKTDLDAHFPIADIQNKIQRAALLRQNGLENEYVNNCVPLHNELKQIPLTLFKKHVWYLDNKINYWSGKYSYFSSHKDYSNNLNKPLKAQIDALDNDIYKVSNFDIEYDRLSQKWSADNTKAYNHPY